MKHDHTRFQTLAAYADEAVVEDRIRRFLPMVRKAAWHVQGGGRSGLDIDDLMQIGLLTLTDCARRHAGPGEDGFAAYAKLRVRGAMIDAIRRAVPDSRGSAARRRQEADKRQALAVQLGREPTGFELASSDSVAARFSVSLTPLDSAYDESSACFADNRPDAFALLSEAEDCERLTVAIAALPERLQTVLQLYFVEELNLAEIAAVFAVSVPRVHQLKAQAIALLRDRLNDGRAGF